MVRITICSMLILSACSTPRTTKDLSEGDREEVINRLWAQVNKEVDEAFRAIEIKSADKDPGVIPVAFGAETPVERRLIDAFTMHRDCVNTHALNVVNASTVGFKRRDVHGRNGRQVVDYSQGSLSSTGYPLDLAIEGEGFFRITLPDGRIAYTRNGTFKKDAEGTLVTCEGYRIEPQITIPDNAIGVTIDECGLVSIADPATPETPTQVGQIETSRFANPQGLTPSGDVYYFPSGQSGPAIDGQPGQGDLGFGKIRQGFLEESNVDVVGEEVRMIVDTRMAAGIRTILERAGKLRPDR